MKLQEAMGILAAKRLDDLARNAERSAEACQLGFEALKAVQHSRQYPDCPFIELLPGETEE